MTKALRIAVVGNGPAGLAAVHAAYGMNSPEAEIYVHLYGPMFKTTQRGPLLLQAPIPGIHHDHPDGYIKQIVIGGTILDYRYKLYGDVNINISGNILQEGYNAWNHIETYNMLWERYVLRTPARVNLYEIFLTYKDLVEYQDHYDLVINTAPLPGMCGQEHNFHHKEVAITTTTEYPGQPVDTIIFNAKADVPWVRSARIFGNEGTEWPVDSAPDDAIIIRKPISHDCDCFPRVLLTGRFGAWRNETWVHTAYYETRDAIIGILRKEIWNVVQ